MIKSNSPVFWRTKYTEFSNKSPKAANRTCCREIILNLLNHPGIIKSHFQEVILEIHYPFPPDFLFVCIFYLMLSVSKLFPKKRLSLSLKQMVMSRPAAARQSHPLMEHQQTHTIHSAIIPDTHPYAHKRLCFT